MDQILDKHEWLFFPISFVTLFQVISAFMFLFVNLDVTFWYILNGVFQYSEIQVRTLNVAVLMQLPALVFWLSILIIIYIKKRKI